MIKVVVYKLQRVDWGFGKVAFTRSLSDVVVVDEWGRKWTCSVARAPPNVVLTTTIPINSDYYLYGDWRLLCMCLGLKNGHPIRMGINKEIRRTIFLSRVWFL